MITTIIPSIGRETLYTRTIPSVQAQSVPWECIVVGDGVELEPVDGITFLTAPAQEYPADPKQRWKVQGTAAFNYGLERANGEWVSYLADDDEYLPEHHEVLHFYHASADVIYGQGLVPETRALYGSLPVHRFATVMGAMICRREKCPPARTTPGDAGWDADWWEDAMNGGLSFLFTPRIVCYYHPAAANLVYHSW